MKKGQNKYDNKPLPVRLASEHEQILGGFQQRTGLTRSFIIRRCVVYAIERFTTGEIDILTLKARE